MKTVAHYLLGMLIFIFLFIPLSKAEEDIGGQNAEMAMLSFENPKITETIKFCIFGDFCDDNGRHFPAAFSVDVWSYKNGERTELIYSKLANEVSLSPLGDYAATPLCLALPDSGGKDEYYLEITLGNSKAYEDITERVIRSGVITEEDVKGLFDGATAVDYYHFREGACNFGDYPILLNKVDIKTPITDSDGDGLTDSEDNCPHTPNPGQADADTDGVGDVCETVEITKIQIDKVDGAKEDKRNNAKKTTNPRRTGDNLDRKRSIPDNIAATEEVQEITDVPFAVVEDPPVYPGCGIYANGSEIRNCTSEKIHAFAQENFNMDLVAEFGLSGITRIYVQFRIRKDGKTEVIGVRGQHPKLEAEARRVVELLPTMRPGKQRGKPIGTLYALPIIIGD